MATTAAANIAESVGSLFGSNKVKTLERENTALHREVADHEETIEALQDRIQTMQADHSREIREMQQKHGREIADKDTRHKQDVTAVANNLCLIVIWMDSFSHDFTSLQIIKYYNCEFRLRFPFCPDGIYAH